MRQQALSHLERLAQSVKEVEKTLKLIDGEQMSAEIRARVVRSLAGDLQADYTGFEAVATRILKARGLVFWKTGGNHVDLLRATVESGILPADERVHAMLFDLLGFRHFFRNAYGVEFRDEEIITKARSFCEVWPAIEQSLTGAIDQISTP